LKRFDLFDEFLETLRNEGDIVQRGAVGNKGTNGQNNKVVVVKVIINEPWLLGCGLMRHEDMMCGLGGSFLLL
jgi:hypothetical protein